VAHLARDWRSMTRRTRSKAEEMAPEATGGRANACLCVRCFLFISFTQSRMRRGVRVPPARERRQAKQEPAPVDRSALPTFDAVRPTQSGRQSGRDAAERARAAAAAARQAQIAAQEYVQGLAKDISTVREEPTPTRPSPAASGGGGGGGGKGSSMDAEALETFALLDADGNGTIDLGELGRGVRQISSDGGAAMLQAIDLSMDGSIDKTEWVQHFNNIARTEGRAAAVELLRKLTEAAKVLAEAKVSVNADGSLSLNLFAT
jgi:hypothetical protein